MRKSVLYCSCSTQPYEKVKKMKFVSAKTAKGNVGVSIVNQRLADQAAAQMDANGCEGCYFCVNCKNCINCRNCVSCNECMGCVKCLKCVKCFRCTFLKGFRDRFDLKQPAMTFASK